jgi:outer membrane translocation and assembly module TamA
MRLKLFDFTSYLFPGTVGLVAFNDVGRVWVPDESSNVWHDGYGAGFYIVPADLILIQAVLAHSVEKTQPYFSIGFRF